MGQGYYIVEISSNNTHLFIAAYDVESPESLLIELPDDRAKDILAEFNQDYESMANSLQVMNKRLVLLNPVSKNSFFNLPLILFGGISSPKQLSNIFAMKEVNAVGIGNFLNYKEHALQVLKEDCDIESIRKPFYRKGRWNHV